MTMQGLPAVMIDAAGQPDGYMPQAVGGKTVWGPPPGGGVALTVQDEDGNVATGVTQLDFQGAGVSAAAGSGEVVVTIPGGTGGGGSSVPWSALTLDSGYVSQADTAGHPPQYRVIGDRVEIRGVIRRNPSANFVTGALTKVFTLPAAAVPAATPGTAAASTPTAPIEYFAGAGSNGVVPRWEVRANGEVWYFLTSGSAAFLTFGFSYSLLG